MTFAPYKDYIIVLFEDLLVDVGVWVIRQDMILCPQNFHRFLRILLQLEQKEKTTLLNTDMQCNDWHSSSDLEENDHSIQSFSKPGKFHANPVTFHGSHGQTFFSVWGVLREKYPSRSTNWAALRPYAGNSGQMAQVNSKSISCWDLLEFLKKWTSKWGSLSSE